MLTVEFTIEPFVEGAPGAHVTAAVAAVEQRGLVVDFGPFGSSFAVPETHAPPPWEQGKRYLIDEL